MKILFAPIHYVLDSQHSGSEFSWSYELYRRFSKKVELDGVYITGGIRGVSDERVVDCNVIKPDQLNVSLVNVIKFYVHVFFASWRLYTSQRFDIVHHVLPFSVGVSFNFLAILVSPRFVIGPVQGIMSYTDRDLNPENARGFQKQKMDLKFLVTLILSKSLSPFLSIFSRWTLQKAQVVIAVNEEAKRQLELFGVKKRNIVVIPPGIDAKSYPHKPFSEKPTDVIELLTVCYLLERKRVDLILRALADVVKIHTNVKLRIVGDGPQTEALHTLVKDLDISSYVIFEGFVPHDMVMHYYQRAHIFVNMSMAEGFATVCLEAMASGLAVVSSEVGGFKDIIEDGNNGYIVEIGNYHLLAERLLYLIEHRDTIQQFSEKGRKSILSHYDWDEGIIPQYMDVYKRTLD